MTQSNHLLSIDELRKMISETHEGTPAQQNQATQILLFQILIELRSLRPSSMDVDKSAKP